MAKKKKWRMGNEAKWLKIIMILLFCAIFLYSCVATTLKAGESIGSFADAIENIGKLDQEDLEVPCTKYLDMYIEKQAEYPHLFNTIGEVVSPLPYIGDKMWSYNDFGALIGRIMGVVSESEASLKEFYVKDHIIHTVQEINLVVALETEEEKEVMELLGVEKVYLFAETEYSMLDETMILGATNVYFSGVEKDSPEMQLVETVLGEGVTVLQQLAGQYLSMALDRVQIHNVIVFGENGVTFTAKEN